MRLLQRYLFILFTLLLFTSIYIPIRYNISYPKPLGPTVDNSINTRHENELVDSKAEIMLIGDSVLKLGIIPDELSSLTGKKVYSMHIAGSASAAWYLAVKNVALNSSHQPRYVVIFFRNTILTAPSYRVNGKYFEFVDELATSKDTLFIQRAFIQQMSPVEQLADQYLPLYGSRLALREEADYSIRYTLPSLFGCDTECNYNANYIVFKENNLDPKLLMDATAAAESYLYTPHQLDFEKQIDGSFLPEIIRLTRENNIQLILVRSKLLDSPDETSESVELKNYIQSLKAYADENDVILLDFAHDERLTAELYSDNYHLNKAGAAVFTKILAEALFSILNQ
jgi:hypothetical protein